MSNQHQRWKQTPPQKEENTNCVFASIGLANPDTRKVYTDFSGRLTVTSNRGMQFMLILYVYDTNNVLAEHIKTRSDADMLRVYDVLYGTLENALQAPTLNITDNESST